MNRAQLAALFSVVVIGMSTPVKAQDALPYVDAVTPYAHSQIMKYRGKTSAGTNETTEEPRRPWAGSVDREMANASTGVGTASSAYAVNPAISATVAEALADLLSNTPAAGHPPLIRDFEKVFVANPAFRRAMSRDLGADREQIVRTLRSRVLRDRYEHLLTSSGGLPDRVGDAHSVFLVLGWKIANNDRHVDGPTAVRALQRSLQRAVERGDRFPAQTDQDKQITVETLGILSVLAVNAWRKARTVEELVTIGNGVTAMGAEAGIDFQSVTLTESGFSPRRTQ